MNALDVIQKTDGTWNVYCDGVCVHSGLSLQQVAELPGEKRHDFYSTNE